MWESLQFILLLIVYIGIYFFAIKLIKKHTTNSNKYFRMLALSFIYALFWGLGIAGSGGEPGFAFPAPNLIALGFMVSIGFFNGIQTEIVIVGFWWFLIFIFMLLKQRIKNKKQVV